METLESKVAVLQSKIYNFTENKLYYETSRCGIEDMKWFSIKNNLIIFYFFRRSLRTCSCKIPVYFQNFDHETITRTGVKWCMAKHAKIS